MAGRVDSRAHLPGRSHEINETVVRRCRSTDWSPGRRTAQSVSHTHDSGTLSEWRKGALAEPERKESIIKRIAAELAATLGTNNVQLIFWHRVS